MKRYTSTDIAAILLGWWICFSVFYIISDIHTSIPMLLLLFITTIICSYNSGILRPYKYNRRPDGGNKGDNNTVSSPLSHVTSVDRIKNLSKNMLNSFDYSFRSAVRSITRKECFASLDYVERLSINDISVLFRYASHSHTNLNSDPRKKKSFLNEHNQNLRAVIGALDIAVKISRGCLLEEREASAASTSTAKTATCIKEENNNNNNNNREDVDALRFVAVTRIFAEWRNLRLIPKKGGYPRYALGLTLAYRDILQNLEKIEEGIHEYLRYHHRQQINEARRNSTSMVIAPSPTLRQLLRFELETDVHKKLPYLKNNSAASGILWTIRQLQYQLATFGNSLQVPEYYPTFPDAAKAAYRTVYDGYHGWAIKHIFSQSFNASPTLDKIWLAINPSNDNNGQHQHNSSAKGSDNRREDDYGPVPPTRRLSDFTVSSATTATASTSDSSSDSQVSSSLSSDSEESITINERHDDGADKFLSSMEKIGLEILDRWEDLLRIFNCGGKEEKKKKHKFNLILSSKSHFGLDQLLNNADLVQSSFHDNGNDTNINTNSNHGCDSIVIDDSSSIISGCSSSTESLQSSGMDESTMDASSNGHHLCYHNRRTVSDDNYGNNPIESSKRDVEVFVKDVLPMVMNLGQIIKEFNMNDPTRA